MVYDNVYVRACVCAGEYVCVLVVISSTRSRASNARSSGEVAASAMDRVRCGADDEMKKWQCPWSQAASTASITEKWQCLWPQAESTAPITEKWQCPSPQAESTAPITEKWQCLW